jgi:hypothetical protein
MQDGNKWGEAQILKIGITRIFWWKTSSFKMLILKDFVHCRKTISLKVGAIHQFTSRVIQFTFFGVWTCHTSLMVPKNLILARSQINFHELSGSILMWHNFGGWFSIGHKIYNSIFLVIVSSKFSFFSPLWKVTSSSMSMFGNSSCFGPPMCLIWTFSYKTYSITFFIILSTLSAYCKQLEKIVNYSLFLFIYLYY